MDWDRICGKDLGDQEMTLQNVLRSDAVIDPETSRILWPRVLCQIRPAVLATDISRGWAPYIFNMLGNNLNLGFEVFRSGEKDDMRSQTRFYCARIKDEDLPWDLTEVDW